MNYKLERLRTLHEHAMCYGFCGSSALSTIPNRSARAQPCEREFARVQQLRADRDRGGYSANKSCEYLLDFYL